jgi:hypothetical protein
MIPEYDLDARWWRRGLLYDQEFVEALGELCELGVGDGYCVWVLFTT